MELILEQLQDKTLEESLSKDKILLKVKDKELSIKARLEGNELYIRKNHSIETNEIILNLFSKSIALALDKSEELALGYGNRSALLFHMRRYKDCNLDINRALDITNSKSLKIKLLCRNVDCLTALGRYGGKETLDLAIQLFKTIKDSNKDKNYFEGIIKKSKAVYERNEKKPSLDSEQQYEQLRDVDPSESVDIRYTEKYGRHLTASRSFKTGDLIFTEKPFVSISNYRLPYIHCTLCLAIAWTSIPCNTCSLCMFCSDTCRDEAWEKYHDVECSVISHIHKLHGTVPQNFHLALRTLIVGMKEAKGIDEFKEELKKIDECIIDKRTRGFSENEKFSSHFNSIYSLSYDKSEKDEGISIRNTALVLAYIAKYTSFLGADILKDHQAISTLAGVKDVLLIGAVLLRLIKICHINAYHVLNSLQHCQHAKENFRCFVNDCEYKALSFVPYYSLINNCCASNVKSCFTRDQKVAIYAVEPIEKGSQIFLSYLCNFYDTPNGINRNELLKKYFHFSCDCSACKQNWPAMLNNSIDGIEGFPSQMKLEMEFELANEYKQKVTASQDENSLMCDATTFTKLAEGIEKAVENLPHPSRMRCASTLSLQRAFEKEFEPHLDLDLYSLFNDLERTDLYSKHHSLRGKMDDFIKSHKIC